MKYHKIRHYSYITLLLVHGTAAFGAFEVSESWLMEKLKSSPPPSLQELELQSLAPKLERSQVDEQYHPTLGISAVNARTNERAFAQFVPVTQESQAGQAEVSVKTLYGQSLSAKVGVSQFSNNFIQNATTTTAGAKLVIDLNKNFLGRQSRAQWQEIEHNTRLQELMKEINTHAFLSGVRKMYWALVANQESLKIAETLLESARKLSLEAKRRYQQSVADSGEVARYDALVASREGKLTSLQYQRERLFQDLKLLLPELARAGQDVALAPYDIQQTILQVLDCTGYLQGQSAIPLDNSLYDEALVFQKEVFAQKMKQRQRYNDWDIKLEGEVNKLGKDSSYSASRENFSNSSQTAWSAGIGINIPLGKAKSRTEDVMEEIELRRHLAQSESMVARMQAHHEQIVHSVGMLQKLIMLQKKNSISLQHSLSVSKRKYEQARISLNELINEQDTFFQNELETINTQLTIINTVLDYLAVYSKTPCQLNQYKL